MLVVCRWQDMGVDLERCQMDLSKKRLSLSELDGDKAFFCVYGFDLCDLCVFIIKYGINERFLY